MSKTDNTHVVLDVSANPHLMRCRHCGASHPMTSPMPISKAIKLSKAFTALHTDCPKTQEVQP